MQAMVLTAPGAPLTMQQRDDPSPGDGEVRVKVGACGVCRTDLHVVDGELPDIALPIIPGHEIVGRVDAARRRRHRPRDRRPRRRSLARLHLRRLPLLPRRAGEPLRRAAVHRLHPRRRLCQPRRRRRALRLSARRAGRRRRDRAAAVRRADRLALAGDGRRRPSGSASTASAPPPTSSRRSRAGRAARSTPSPGRGDDAAQDFARSLGAVWAGGSDELPPEPLDAAIIFAPVGRAGAGGAARGAQGRPRGLRRHPHERHPELSLRLLWGSGSCVSVANLTRQDGVDFLAVAQQAGIRTETHAFALRDANAVLDKLRAGELLGAAVLTP